DTFINMDKSWMETNRISKSYVDGVAAFTDYATKHGEEEEPSISAPKPVNATIEFVDDMDFAYIPTDGPAIVEMVNATKDNFAHCNTKEIILKELDKMQAELVVTLCLLEKFFPLSFFDIMIHLTMHLTRIKPEGCIAEETITKETIEFFSEYHKSMETIGILPGKHETYENEEGKPLSAGKSSEVSAELFQKAHLY
ncbi:putative ribonuclease H-like domain-containing protein, partial [Tanacetum coccineum]